LFPDGVQRLMGLATRPIPKAAFVEVSLEDRLQHDEQRHLHDSVHDVRHPQRPLFAIGLGYPDAFDRTGLVAAVLQLRLQGVQELLRAGFHLLGCHPINPRRSSIRHHCFHGGF
jgi:hypothetical protein